MTDRATSVARYLGALALLAVGVDHIEQYYVDYYRAVPTIGTLFLANFVSATVVAALLVAPLRRLAGRFTDRVLTALVLSGIGIAAGTLAGLLISENGGLFGFMEVGYRGAIVLSIAFDVAAITFLAAFLFLRRRRTGPDQPDGLRPASRSRAVRSHQSIAAITPRPPFDRRAAAPAARHPKETK